MSAWTSLCAVSLVAPLGALQSGASSQPSLLVTVPAPAKGPVSDLTAKDFKVFDGKEPIDVSAAERATTPLSIEVIVENTLRPMETSPTDQLRKSLRGFVDAIRAGNADAKIGLFTDAGAAVPMVDLNAPPADLDTVISQFTPVREVAGALLEALVDAGHALAEVPVSRPRRAIVTIDFAASDPTSKAAILKVEGAVVQSGASLWSVSVTGTRDETPQREVMLVGLTKDSGGRRQSISSASGLQFQMNVIANCLLSQYTLQLARPVSDPKALRIETPKGKALVSSFIR
jgi:hypothetical protein